MDENYPTGILTQPASPTVQSLAQRLELLMVNTEESFVLIDTDFRIVTFNEQFSQEYEQAFKREMKRGDSILKYAFSDPEELRQTYQKVFAGEIIEAEMKVSFSPGIDTFIIVRYKPAYDEARHIIGAFVSKRDITQAKKAELELKKSEEKYRSIIENSLNAFLIAETDGRINFANKTALDLFGYTREEIVTLSRKDVTIATPELAALLQVRLAEGRCQGEMIGKKKNGELFQGEFSSTFFTDTDGVKRISTIIQDVSERKKTQSELLKTNELLEVSKQIYQSLFNHHISAVFSLDLEGNFTSANSITLQRAGFSLENILGVHYSKLVHPDSLQKTLANFNKAKNGVSTTYEIQIFVNGNDVINVIMVQLPIIVHDEIIGVFCIANDITEERKAQAELKQTLADRQRILDYSIDIICSFDRYGNFLQINNACYDMWGYRPEELIGMNYFDLLYKEDQDRTRAVLFKAMSGEDIRNFENRHLRKNGSMSHIVWSARWDEETQIMFAVGGDISDRILAEAQKDFERGHREVLINSTTDLIWSVDEDLNLISANNAFMNSMKQLTGIVMKPGDALIIPGMYPEVHLEGWRRLYKRALEGLSFQQEVYTAELAGSGQEWSFVSFNPIYREGNIVGVACYARNITESKYSEVELKNLNEQLNVRANELADSNSELEHFAYIASHDLQEPLRMVTGFLNLLEKKYAAQLDETAGKYIWYAVDGAARMRKIISDLLEYSRVGRQQYSFDEIDTNSLMEEVLHLNKNIISDTNAAITWQNMPVIIGAKTPIQQVFQNLIANAIKYQRKNTAPQILISAETFADHWKFCVKDNGIGIAPEYFEKVFVLFQRLHTRDEFSGTGIGLAICRKIIDNHHGKIWVESEPGEGSRFYFTIARPHAAA
ncbi:MAG: hypothetical protein JWQ27_1998 [Ferruginibacter sp.]|nr:hypothetical protein [Ferruginibacter sp.]